MVLFSHLYNYLNKNFFKFPLLTTATYTHKIIMRERKKSLKYLKYSRVPDFITRTLGNENFLPVKSKHCNCICVSLFWTF